MLPRSFGYSLAHAGPHLSPRHLFLVFQAGGVGLPDLRGTKKAVDPGVKEALRALRAAALSEFAVGA